MTTNKIGHSEDPFNVYKKKLIHKWKIEQFFPISDDRGGFASEDIEYQKDGKWILCESNVVIDSLDKLPCRLRQDYPE